jgi:phosphohistidine phosphatase
MRTKETFGRIRKAWNQEIPVDEDPGLYLAELPYLKSKILALAPLVRSLMIVGHNPGLSLLVQSLSSEPIDIPTGGMVVLAKELPSWDEAFLTSWSFEAKFLS